MTVHETLKKILPPDLPIPSSFEQVGHIAHLNLREELLFYKRAIGQVILEKNGKIKVFSLFLASYLKLLIIVCYDIVCVGG